MHNVKLSKIEIASEKIGDLVRTVCEIVAYVQDQDFLQSVLFVCKTCMQQCSTFVGYHHSAGAAKRSNKVFRKDHFYKKPFWLNHLHWLGSCKSLEILAGVKS